MRYDPSDTAVIVVDMQNGFCHPDGSLYAEPSEAAIDPVTDLVDRARKAGARVVYTRDVHPPEQFEDVHYYDEFDRWGEHVVEGSAYANPENSESPVRATTARSDSSCQPASRSATNSAVQAGTNVAGANESTTARWLPTRRYSSSSTPIPSETAGAMKSGALTPTSIIRGVGPLPT